MSGKHISPPAPLSDRGPARRVLHAAVFDAKCVAVLAGMRIALSTIGYGAIRSGLPRPQGRADSRFWGRQVARRIERLARFVPGASCLTQALALQFILGRAGHASHIQIGVRQKTGGTFLAHAWVTCNGRVVLGQRGTRLADFSRITELG